MIHVNEVKECLTYDDVRRVPRRGALAVAPPAAACAAPAGALSLWASRSVSADSAVPRGLRRPGRRGSVPPPPPPRRRDTRVIAIEDEERMRRTAKHACVVMNWYKYTYYS